MMRKWRVKKLSTALRQSLDDLRKVERRKKTYTVDMGFWHETIMDRRCVICLAGARMVGLGADPETHIDPHNSFFVDIHTRNMLRAVNYLREGHVRFALQVIGWGKKSGLVDDRPITKYGEPGFWRDLRKLQRDLEKAGL